MYLAFALWPSPACSCRPRKPPPPAGSKRVGASSARPPSSDTLGTRLIGRSSRRPPWPRRGRAPTGGGRRRAGGGPPGRGETRGRPCESWKGRKNIFSCKNILDRSTSGRSFREIKRMPLHLSPPSRQPKPEVVTGRLLLFTQSVSSFSSFAVCALLFDRALVSLLL